jgi:FMN phosphatase YigB (HAD superfamily)
MGEIEAHKQQTTVTVSTDTTFFFDLDGTLVDTDYSNFLSYKQAIQSVTFATFNISYNPTVRFTRSLLKAKVPNLDESQYSMIIQQKEGLYRDNLPHTKLNNALADVITTYSKTHCLVLVSNCREDRARLLLNHYGLADKFKHLFFRRFESDTQRVNKFQNAITNLHISPSSIIAYENEENEILDARAAGIQHINPSMLKHSFMNRFIIEPNEFLAHRTEAFYHSDYHGGAGRWQIVGTIENVICTLKNDITPYSNDILERACRQLEGILLADLPEILRLTQLSALTVCLLPRAKVNYRPDQLYFKSTVLSVVNQLSGFMDGLNYISRHSDTKTTHRAKAGYGGSGKMPYPNITNDTCTISDEVRGKDILLIDDLYTKSINIDEDAIQALLSKGAKSVVFYSVGKAV